MTTLQRTRATLVAITPHRLRRSPAMSAPETGVKSVTSTLDTTHTNAPLLRPPVTRLYRLLPMTTTTHASTGSDWDVTASKTDTTVVNDAPGLFPRRQHVTTACVVGRPKRQWRFTWKAGRHQYRGRLTCYRRCYWWRFLVLQALTTSTTTSPARQQLPDLIAKADHNRKVVTAYGVTLESGAYMPSDEYRCEWRDQHSLARLRGRRYKNVLSRQHSGLQSAASATISPATLIANSITTAAVTMATTPARFGTLTGKRQPTTLLKWDWSLAVTPSGVTKAWCWAVSGSGRKLRYRPGLATSGLVLHHRHHINDTLTVNPAVPSRRSLVSKPISRGEYGNRHYVLPTGAFDNGGAHGCHR